MAIEVKALCERSAKPSSRKALAAVGATNQLTIGIAVAVRRQVGRDGQLVRRANRG